MGLNSHRGEYFAMSFGEGEGNGNFISFSSLFSLQADLIGLALSGVNCFLTLFSNWFFPFFLFTGEMEWWKARKSVSRHRLPCCSLGKQRGAGSVCKKDGDLFATGTGTFRIFLEKNKYSRSFICLSTSHMSLSLSLCFAAIYIVSWPTVSINLGTTPSSIPP